MARRVASEQVLIVTTYEYCTKRSNLRARYQTKILSKLILYEKREVAALLEMALWKSQIRQAMPLSSSNGIDAKDRQNCRVPCKAEFFVRMLTIQQSSMIFELSRSTNIYCKCSSSYIFSKVLWVASIIFILRLIQ
jgi:hypothetical protein